MAPRVMIAEDEPNIVTSLEFLMRKAGFDTRIARDGEEALGVLVAFRPDVVLLDVMLPRRSGLEVCRFIRAEPSLAATRVLMLTAKGGRNDQHNGLEAGADEYLTKPFSTQELLERVKALAAKGSA
ncbi:MAG: response regulator [Betaproteobacteria bacterium]|nr:response regulator [Betaproteobacteria bacterium]